MRNPAPPPPSSSGKAGRAAAPAKDPAPPRRAEPAAEPPVAARPTYEEIARRAFEIYQREGCLPGRDFENWLKAEAELTGGGGH
jgi:hypothetical protein